MPLFHSIGKPIALSSKAMINETSARPTPLFWFTQTNNRRRVEFKHAEQA
jgi:hypothetical protein